MINLKELLKEDPHKFEDIVMFKVFLAIAERLDESNRCLQNVVDRLDQIAGALTNETKD